MSLMSEQQKDSIIRRIESVDTCDDLRQLKEEVNQLTQDLIAAATAKLEELSPLLSLLEIPTSPDEVVEWVKAFIEEYLKKTLSPVLTLQIQLPITLTYIAEIGDALIDKASEIKDCTVGSLEVL